MSYYDDKFPDGFALKKFTRKEFIEMMMSDLKLHKAINAWREGELTWVEAVEVVLMFYLNEKSQEDIKRCAEIKYGGMDGW